MTKILTITITIDDDTDEDAIDDVFNALDDNSLNYSSKEVDA